MKQIKVAARTGKTDWTCPKSAVVGEAVFFIVLGQGVLARGEVASLPKPSPKSWGFPGRYAAKIGAVELLGTPVSLELLAERFPDWGFPRYPRSYTTVEDPLASQLAKFFETSELAVVALKDFKRDRDRRDPQRAARLFDLLWPDPAVRAACGDRLAQSIRHAHEQAAASWEVTMFADRIRLNVGQVEVLKLSSDEIVVLFRAPLKTKVDKRFSVDLDPANPVYSAVPVDSGVCRFAPADLEAVPRTLWAAHESFIDVAANAKKVSPFKKSFSDAVLRHVESLLGCALPRPSYLVGPDDNPVADDLRNHVGPWVGKAADSSKRRSQVPTGAGFGDPEQNRKVEQAAVRIASEWYRREGWQVASVEAQRCGFDLLCERDGTEMHVEVKGAAGSERRFVVTAGELRHAIDDDRFVLTLVTDALTEHHNLEHWSARSFRDEFDFEPIQYWATAKKAATSSNHSMQPTRKRTRAADA